MTAQYSRAAAVLASLVALASGAGERPAAHQKDAKVRPGVSILVRDSLSLLRRARVGLVTNQTGIDEKGQSDVDILYAALPRVGAKLTMLFSPEHGIRGTEDRANIANARDRKTGLPVISLFTTQAVPPPDSALRDLDAVAIDLFDIGTRTWTYVGTMLYTMRAAARRGIPVFVLDRPNPLGGRVEGPMLDAAFANADDPTPTRAGRAYALYPAPLRHGMTMGELATWFNAELAIGANLHVIRAAGWRRSMWWDETGIPWVNPSPNIPSLTSALLYPALVALEGSNVSVGRGTPTAFQRFGAPWMDAARVAKLLSERDLSGVRFLVDPFTPDHPGDGKFAGQRIPGIRIEVTVRDRVQAARVGAAVVWALAKVHPDSLRLSPGTFDARFGAAALRTALASGSDPDDVIDRDVAAVSAWQRATRKFLLYY